MRKPNFEVHTNCEVMKINTPPATARVQKFSLYILIAILVRNLSSPATHNTLRVWTDECAYAAVVWNLNSADPNKAQGVIGRNYCYQTGGGGLPAHISTISDLIATIGAGALGMAAHDYNGDAFDHSGFRTLLVASVSVRRRPDG